MKETIPSSSITWSEMGKQNVQAEKVYNVQEVVERQFQMPCKVFKSLIGNAESSDIIEEQDEQVRKRHLSKVS